MKETAAPRRLALIDRDGTIIVDKVYLSDPDGIEFAPGAIDGLRLLRDAGFALVLITNQSGIARGYFDVATLERIHGRLLSMLATEGLRLEAIYVCPHGPGDSCDCRKPAPGMITNAMRDLGLSRPRPWLSATATPIWGRLPAAGVWRCASPPPVARIARRGAAISSKPLVARARSSPEPLFAGLNCRDSRTTSWTRSSALHRHISLRSSVYFRFGGLTAPNPAGRLPKKTDTQRAFP